MINMLRGGALAAASLRPVAPPVQASASERGAAPSAQESVSPEPGKPVGRELSDGQSHSYKITMTSGQYLHVVVAQRGIDVAVALFTPDDKKIGEVDSHHYFIVALLPLGSAAPLFLRAITRLEAFRFEQTFQPVSNHASAASIMGLEAFRFEQTFQHDPV